MPQRVLQALGAADEKQPGPSRLGIAETHVLVDQHAAMHEAQLPADDAALVLEYESGQCGIAEQGIEEARGRFVEVDLALRMDLAIRGVRLGAPPPAAAAQSPGFDIEYSALPELAADAVAAFA